MFQMLLLRNVELLGAQQAQAFAQLDEADEQTTLTHLKPQLR